MGYVKYIGVWGWLATEAEEYLRLVHETWGGLYRDEKFANFRRGTKRRFYGGRGGDIVLRTSLKRESFQRRRIIHGDVYSRERITQL